MSGVAFNRPEIIGRQRERQFLRDLLASAIAGQGGLVLVSGEAGIGKTTLVDELITHARDAGALVLTGGCYDLTTTPPYGPWTEAIRAYRPASGQPAVPSWFGNLDELEKLGSQAAIFEEARQFFASLAEHQPLLIVLEDLHWTDPASVDALRFLARTLRASPILILATYRDDEPLPNEPLQDALPALVRESRAERIELRRWPENDTRALIADSYGLSLDDEDRLTTHTHQLAEGNPLFTIELLRVFEGDATLQRDAGHWMLADLTPAQVPPLVRQVIEQRLRNLSSATRELLEIAAVIGHDVPFDLWHAVSDASHDDIAGAVREASDTQLIDEAPDRTGIRFRHALIREALYESLDFSVRRQRHARIAELLIERVDPDPDSVAYHFKRADDSRTTHWLLLSGWNAERLAAWKHAADRYISVAQRMKGEQDRINQRALATLRSRHVASICAKREVY